MNAKNTEDIIREVAKRHHVSPQEVSKSIDAVISRGLNSDDPKLKGLWQSMGDGNHRPEVGDVIHHLASLVTVKLIFDSCSSDQKRE